MHIKQVIIRGFKTYKEQTSLDEDFAPGTNCIVGFNGSGKSNFFQAILFVLSDQYTAMRAETRKSLLHEGAGQAVLTAFVEVVLDNTDRRIPVDSDQVSIRRLFGVKKDDWLLDGRHSTRAEIFGLLEGAGFAKTNPYYIVQQGKVSELTMMSDAQRLELLKDISGAGIYDERRSESVKIMEDTATRRSRTKDLVVEIKDKLKALEDEQRELRDCEIKEARKRTLEYVLADREWRSAQDRLEELNARRAEASAKLVELQNQVGSVRRQAGEATSELERQEEERRRSAESLVGLEAQRDKKFEALSSARLAADNESRRQRELDDKSSARLQEIYRARAQVQAAGDDLAALRPQAAKAEGRFREIDQRRQVAGTLREQLVAKQCRKQQYDTIEARNAALDEEIRRSTGRLDEGRQKLATCTERIARAEERAVASATSAQKKRQELIGVEQQLGELGKDVRSLGEALDKSSEQHRLLHQQRSRLIKEAEQWRTEAHGSQGRLEATMPRACRQAVTAVSRWAEEHGVQDRLRGTLLQYIEVPPTFRAAVESFAGMSLFNVLATDDEVAAEAVKFVRTKRLGAVVVTPLNQLRSRHMEYPDIEGVKPMIEVIRCPDWAKPAVMQVFGSGVVCRNMELCEQVARSHGVDAITLDGDRVSRRGVVTGGYQDPGRLVRLPLAETVRAAHQKSREAEAQLPALQAQAAEAAESLDALHAERRQKQEQRDAVRARMQGMTEEVQSLEEAGGKQRRHLEELSEWRHRMEVLIRECEASVQGKKAERASKSLKGLTPQEEQQLASLSVEVEELAVAQESAKAETSKLKAVVDEREAQLENCHRRRLHALELEAVGVSQEALPEEADEAALACARLEREHREAADGAAGASRALSAASEAKEVVAKRCGELALQEQPLQEEAAQVALRVERLEAEAAAQAQRKAEVDGRLSGLAAPAAEVEKCRQLPKPELVREMADIGKQLQAFQHVNRKAVEQYENFAEQLKDLERRLADIDAGEASITDALAKIDAQKEATLLQTLLRMDEHFQQVFAEMVPGGKGRLQVLRQKAEGGAANALAGVKIEVSFTGQAESFLVMRQLSGGQKTVVALSLIFAVQRLEPAPFYLLDECDAALDASYRTALANLVARTAAGGSQVILTTFRPEALEKADSCYRVYQQNRASRIDAVTREQAQQVLREQDRLAEAEVAASAQGALTAQ